MSFFERFAKFSMNDSDVAKFGTRIRNGRTEWGYVELKDGTRYEIKLMEEYVRKDSIRTV